MPTKEEVMESLKGVYDPEIPVNIVDLGLIYDVALIGEGSEVNVKMTMTTQGCPAAQMLPGMVQDTAMNVPGVTKVNVDVVWEPQWHPSMITPEGKKRLGIEE
ncbi:MAG: DUF59 domain-containing protein [Nitrospirae bacterium]|nr:DUF59 domain-containing protein [Nitrospirota bacterium]